MLICVLRFPVKLSGDCNVIVQLSERSEERRQLDGWIDGWIDGWMDLWMDGWING